MHRSLLRTALDRYRAGHPAERATVDRFDDFVVRQPQCFERTLTEGHITGSAWLVDATGARVLLTHHRKLDRWLQLGGHADGDTDPLRVALREAEEESGLADLVPCSRDIYDLDIHRIPARAGEPAHDHYDVRYAICAAGKPTYRVSAESISLAWIEIEALADRTDDTSLLRMAAKWRARSDAQERQRSKR